MKSLTILCDADDTIEHLLPHWLDALNRAYQKDVKPEDIHSWNLALAYPDLTSEQVFAPIYTKAFWENITPMEDSQYYLERLIEDGHKVYILSAANFETSDVKVEKLLKLFPFLDWTKIILAHDKQMIRGDVLIDDGIHNLKGGHYRKLLFHQPHNAEIDEIQYGAIRVHSWKETYELINQFAKENEGGRRYA